MNALCNWLGVSRSGYYAWRDRAVSARSIEDDALSQLIQKIYTESEGRYGSPRIQKALEKQGHCVGKKRVERLMREAGLVADMSLTVNALRYALRTRGYPKGVIVHSDRGVEFIGHEYQSMLRWHGLEHSVNRVGCCTDNAHMESFYHSLKTELIRGSTFESLKELRSAIGRYINRFYNTVRLHSGINCQSPVEYEDRLVCN